ncbi:Protein of unknown function [Cohaesibacter marisflavi]|uniref:DUF1499 domain-containing protein n=1 Tax=Cohaesibacter marisflavi TaxID=655353 RepID=A0A1I4ZI10_9HYPH|nr:DUF1499 domain-containing protein [Cohaesibacter marisflavi]SFN49787.1 Protein of unknown function [Cohaesibacter marisflavi]
MAGIYKFKTSRLAHRALWFARLSIPVAILSFLLMRFGGLHPSIALYCFAASVCLALLSILTSWVAFHAIWFDGQKGGRALWGAFLRSLVVLLPSLVFGYFYFTLPPFSDLSTNPLDPPEFVAAWQMRGDSDNALSVASLDMRERQALAYPALKSQSYAQSVALMQLAVADELAKNEWQILRAEEQKEEDGSAYYEAYTRSVFTGLRYVVSIRLSPAGEDETRLDMRSASLWGPRDFGMNARRILGFIAGIESRLDTNAQRYELKLEEIERLRRLQRGPIPRPKPENLGQSATG